MAYGKFTNYEPTETPGAYRFMDASGSPWLLHGPQAEDLKAKLDATASMQPKLAANGDPSRLAGLMNAAAAQNPENQARAKLEGELGGGAVPKATPEQVAAASTPAQPTGPGGAKYVGAGLYEQNGEVGRFRGPTAGSPGGLELRGETRQGVQELDPEFMAAQDDLQIDRRLALQERQDAEREEFRLRAAHQKEMEQIAVNQAAEAQARDAEIGKQFGELQQKYDKAEKEVASAKVDPEGGRNFLDTIAMTFGAIGANLAKHPNYAAEIVQRKIDRRIAAQEHAINIKRETKNDLAEMLKVTNGDRKLARAALDAAYTRKAQAVFESRATQTGDKLLKAQHMEQAMQMQDVYLLKRKAWEDAAKGEVTQSYVKRPAVAATRGGFVPEKDQIGTQSRLVELEKKKQELAQGQQGTAEGAEKGLETADADTIAAAVSTYQLADKVEKQLPKESTFDPGGLTRYLPFVGPEKSEADALNATTAELAAGIQKNKKLGASDADAERADKFASGTGSLESRQRHAQAAKDEAAGNLALKLQTMSPAARDRAWKSLPPEVQAAVKQQMGGK